MKNQRRRFPVLIALAILAGQCLAASGTESYIEQDSWGKMSDLPVALSNHQAKVFGNYLVVTGGRDRLGKPLAQVFTARINGNGSLDKWKSEAPLSGKVSNHAMESLNGYAYITGGMRATGSGESASSEAWMCQLGKDGFPGKWRRTADLPEKIHSHCMVAFGKYLYVIGGISLEGFRNSVYKGTIGPDGGIVGWKSILGIPSALAYSSALAINGYIILVGGQSPGEGRTLIMPTVYVGPLVKNGEPSTWYLASSKLPGAWLSFGRCQGGLASYNNTIACFGGQDSSWFFIKNIASTRFDPEKGEFGNWGVGDGPEGMQQVGQVAQWKDRVFLVGGMLGGVVTPQVRSVKFGTKDREDPR